MAVKVSLSLAVVCGIEEIDHVEGSRREHDTSRFVCCVSFASNSFGFLSRSSHALIQQTFSKIKTTKEIENVIVA